MFQWVLVNKDLIDVFSTVATMGAMVVIMARYDLHVLAIAFPNDPH
jgi:hypothetical protein